MRALLGSLRAGKVVGIGREGRRSRSGRLGDVNPVLARLAARAAVPIVPVGIAGSHRALPRGARIPSRRKIIVRVGAPFRLERNLPPSEAAHRIGEAIAALLLPDQQADGWTSTP